MAATDLDRMVIRRTDTREVFKNPNPPTETLDDLLKREAELGILYAAEDKTCVVTCFVIMRLSQACG